MWRESRKIRPEAVEECVRFLRQLRKRHAAQEDAIVEIITSLQQKRAIPWPPVRIPPNLMSEKVGGDWLLGEEEIPFLRGYFTGLQVVEFPKFPILSLDGTVYMSGSPAELETQAPHIAAATGCTVIAGGGLGISLYNILAKPDVTEVVLIEIDPDIVDYLKRVSRSWPGAEKLKLMNRDVFDVKRLCLPEEIDFLFMDIWPTLGSYDAFNDTCTVQKRIKAKCVGFWGQELDFISWVSGNGNKPPPTDDQYNEWMKEIGLPLKVQGAGYAALCFEAAKNAAGW